VNEPHALPIVHGIGSGQASEQPSWHMPAKQQWMSCQHVVGVVVVVGDDVTDAGTQTSFAGFGVTIRDPN